MNKYQLTTISLLGAACSALPLSAQQPEKAPPSEQKEVTVFANRIETEVDKVSSSLTVLTEEDLEQRGVHTLQDALQTVPGVYSTSFAGQRGNTGSLFIRGGSSDHAHLRVDGIRLSGQNLELGSLLGTLSLQGNDRLEILKGPQSALYGSDSISGAVGISLEKVEKGGTTWNSERGTFRTSRYGLQHQGIAGDFSYQLQANYEDTENSPAPGRVQDFDTFNTALRFDYRLNDTVALGSTIRYSQSDYDNGQLFENDFSLVTLFSDITWNDVVSSKVTFGHYREEYTIDSVMNRLTNHFSLDSLNTLTWNDAHTTVFGATLEMTRRDSNAFFTFKEDSELFSLYVNHSGSVTESFHWDLGVRYENDSNYGDFVSAQAGVNYSFDQTGTKVFASLGTGYRAPTFQEINTFDSPAFPPFVPFPSRQLPNPSLDPEESIGVDFGLEQELFGQNVKFTYFFNFIEDAITLESQGLNPLTGFVESQNRNVDGETKLHGFEFEISNSYEDLVGYSVSWTHQTNSLGVQLDDAVKAQVWYKPMEPVLLSLTGQYVGTRELAGSELDSYFDIGCAINVQVSESRELYVRFENILNERYELSNFGTPELARGRGIFGGVKLHF